MAYSGDRRGALQSKAKYSLTEKGGGYFRCITNGNARIFFVSPEDILITQVRPQIPSSKIKRKKKDHVRHGWAARLTNSQRWQVVQWYAELKTPAEIVDLVKKKFHVTISKSAIWRYGNSPRWSMVISRLKKQIEKDLCKIPIAKKSHRLRMLNEVARDAILYGKYKEAVMAIKEAREEMQGYESPDDKFKDQDLDFLTDNDQIEGRERLTKYLHPN